MLHICGHMIKIHHKGDFKRTTKFLNKVKDLEISDILHKYGQIGVEALSEATPIRTGETSNAWKYDIGRVRGGYSVTWSNTHLNDGVNIALILQLGHGTGTGGYVQGIDYINPALTDIFDEIAESAWREVTMA